MITRPAKWTIILSAVAGLGLYYIFFMEGSYSLVTLKFHFRLEQAMKMNGKAYFKDLVDFEWDRVYVIGAYGEDALLRPERIRRREKNIKTSWGLRWWWWKNNTDYWSIIYMRPHQAPFLVRMNGYFSFILGKYRRRYADENSAYLRIFTGWPKRDPYYPDKFDGQNKVVVTLGVDESR